MLIAQAPTAPEVPHGLSTEQLKQLTELVRAASRSESGSVSMLSLVKSTAELIASFAWPLAVILCALLFRKQATAFLGEIDTVKGLGIEISRKLQRQLNESAQEATTTPASPTERERVRAVVVEDLVAGADIAVIRAQADQLAMDYETVRAANRPGDDRTLKMSMVVFKMRAIGRAVFPLRYEFANSLSPGRRLIAIATLQIQPDYDMLDWLASRVGSERPFVEYQALVALQEAAHSAEAKYYWRSLQAAAQEARSNSNNFNNDSSRIDALEDIENAVRALSRQPA